MNSFVLPTTRSCVSGIEEFIVGHFNHGLPNEPMIKDNEPSLSRRLNSRSRPSEPVLYIGKREDVEDLPPASLFHCSCQHCLGSVLSALSNQALTKASTVDVHSDDCAYWALAYRRVLYGIDMDEQFTTLEKCISFLNASRILISEGCRHARLFSIPNRI